MKVMIIPEDFRKDQYILKPLFSRLFKRSWCIPFGGLCLSGPFARRDWGIA